jgi:uncharacterized protein (TIGR02246 family)
MYCRNLISYFCFIGVALLLCGPVHAADDAAAICNAVIGAYEAASVSGDPAKMAAVFAPDGKFVTPFGVLAGHDAVAKTYASFMKPGDKHVDTLTSTRMAGDVALCSGGRTFTPASGGSDSKGFFVKVVGKVGGEWKILNLTYNLAPPK